MLSLRLRHHHHRQFLCSLHTSHAPPPARVRIAYELHHPHHSRHHDHPLPQKRPPTAPILFLHGFLVSKRENRQISRQLAKDTSRTVYALMEMARDVKWFLEEHQLQEPTIIGHSMGAKTALILALESPNLIKDVVAIDNCPIHLPLEEDFVRYLQGLARLRELPITSHRQADGILAAYEKVRSRHSAVTRLFTLLHQLYVSTRQFGGRVLFLRALQSQYIPETAFPSNYSFFPNARIVDVDSSHWIVQEKPEEGRRSTYIPV
ncbi:alpha/beta-hydrolase [Aspergillus saccharolyticus JOP 1030-1]|uniref:Alpha/beta-hydrolase n=1 Tax=Aspergillus saccharolyticus JOP 1030-1 TaxID=1450539 RepID=A0A318ZJ47_9EURO|nr:alpha/beta-hydrolase [Aspergillus saccharolyticus JOP 1030-1]PYH46827.1 alpha/beta-hydrolase [Aspergillus saccharolyticus JOP 1030-1]